MGFFDSIKGFFVSAGQKIGDGAKSVGNWVDKNIVGGVKSVVGTLHQDARDLIGGAGGLVGNTISGGQGVVNNLVNKGGSTLSSLGESLSFPLLLAGGAALVFVISNRR